MGKSTVNDPIKKEEAKERDTQTGELITKWKQIVKIHKN